MRLQGELLQAEIQDSRELGNSDFFPEEEPIAATSVPESDEEAIFGEDFENLLSTGWERRLSVSTQPEPEAEET